MAWTGAGRTAFGQSLSHVQEMGWVARNPGHGHPLRPEFVLTDAGHVMAQLAQEVLAIANEPADKELLRRAWTLPAVAAMAAPQRFSDMRRRLAPVTDRALSQTLQVLEAERWVARDVEADARPPRPVYSAKGMGADLCQIIGVAA